ncbi:hypothetical protein HPB50_019856 [Hyalomma asiaticum]|uniref:Uncharacterized protein n=1 Tax=Hyalomma asiaticum TaxID=266040 RepID=A0ACB7RQT3_HYAAI|nr:hypothetical protein HPB50_019856 [Hyalomma asiaticum]
MQQDVPEVSARPLLSTKSSKPMTPSMSHNAVRLPPFWPDYRDIWFLQVEARFEAINIILKHSADSALCPMTLPSKCATSYLHNQANGMRHAEGGNP